MELVDVRSSDHPELFSSDQLPEINFSHINNLTDETGIIQHAVFDMPNRKEGYCLDDNARALLLCVWTTKSRINPTATRLMPVYLSFIHYMQNDNGYFRNFMTYSKHTPEDRGSEDSFGRTLMALGFLINEASSQFLIRNAREIFSRAYARVGELISLRAIATSIIGICQVIKYAYPDDEKRNKVIELADKMVKSYNSERGDNWNWFEPILTYDNAMLPLALLNAYEITQDKKYLSVSIESMSFLESKVFSQDILRPIGNQGWHAKGDKIAKFDQQGIDAMSMVLYYQQAFRITRKPSYLSRMYKSYQWFLGGNDLRLPLYDPSTGGCADGLHRDGINLNQGAESTLAYWISHVVVAAALEE